jgi:hypothetical protein
MLWVLRVIHPVSLVSLRSALIFATTSSTFDIFNSLRVLDRAFEGCAGRNVRKIERPTLFKT